MIQKSTFPHRTAAELEVLQARFALNIAARLSEGAQQAPRDIAERLRFAREQALQRARDARAPALAPATVASPNGAAGLTLAINGPRSTPWWLRLASVLPLCALVAGLLLIQESNTRAQIRAAAEIDTALLSDDLPPTAYSDPGFGEFLKTSGH
jgi:hypothetical protein